MKLKAKHEDTLLYPFIEANKRLKHIQENAAVNFEEMSAWEEAEFKHIVAGYKEQIKSIKKHMMAHESIFNEVLSEYDMTVVSFISKYSYKYHGKNNRKKR